MKFTFEYSLKKLTLVEENNEVFFVNDKKEKVFSFEGLFMVDSDNNYSTDVKLSYKLIKKDVYEITVTPNDEWIKNASYPVLIDPTISNATVQLNYMDTYVYENNPINSHNYYYASMYVGDDDGYRFASLVKFDVPQFLNEQIINYAYITFSKYSSPQDNFQINVFKNLSTFYSTTRNWEDKPQFNANEIVDYTNC